MLVRYDYDIFFAGFVKLNNHAIRVRRYFVITAIESYYREGDSALPLYIISRGGSFLQIVCTGSELVDLGVISCGRAERGYLLAVLVDGGYGAVLVAVELKLCARKTIILFVDLSEQQIIALGIVGKDDIVFSVRDNGSVNGSCAGEYLYVAYLSVQLDLSLYLGQFIAGVRRLGDCIGRAGGDVRDTDAFAVGYRKRYSGSFAAVARRQNVTVVIKTVAVLISRTGTAYIFAVFIMIVIITITTIYAVPGYLLADEHAGVVVKRNREFKFLV